MIHRESWYREAALDEEYQRALKRYMRERDPDGELLRQVWRSAERLGILPAISTYSLWTSYKVSRDLSRQPIKVRRNSNDFRREWEEIPLEALPGFISSWAKTEGEERMWGPQYFDWYPGMKDSPQVLKGETVEWLEIDVPPQWLAQIREWVKQMGEGTFKW